MNNGYIGVIATLGFAMLMGCSQEQESGPDPLGEASVAMIDGMPIQTELFNYYSRGRLQKEPELLTDEEYTALLDELTEFRLLARAAEAEGLTDDVELAAQLEIQRLQALSRIMASHVLDENPATDAELQIAYQQNLDEISAPQYKARHILLDSEDEALGIIEELQQGASFEELAQTRSTGPSGPSGGDLGWFTTDSMVAPFSDAITSMEVGTFTAEPVATRFGWHVILLEDVTASQPPGLDAVREEIRSFVEQQRIQEYLESLREAAEISVGDAGLPD
jgi:peptidyl-prolyl cis-trans isomerase C